MGTADEMWEEGATGSGLPDGGDGIGGLDSSG